jgi:CRISPR-associated endoribonuclease Cas6
MMADNRSKLIGCVGEVNYRILGEASPELVKHVNVLADFALYSGVGRKTPMGMGMLRRLNTH